MLLTYQASSVVNSNTIMERNSITDGIIKSRQLRLLSQTRVHIRLYLCHIWKLINMVC